MQPIRQLAQQLSKLATAEHYLFTPADLRALLPNLSNIAFKTLLSRAVKQGILLRVSRGLYCYESVASPGFVLFHAAAKLRANGFNYISLETALSDAGIISQIPINWITIMSSGRSNKIVCGDLGVIEFVHTTQSPTALVEQLTYDNRCRLWRANITLALRDMRATRRNLDLIDWSMVDELI